MLIPNLEQLNLISPFILLDTGRIENEKKPGVGKHRAKEEDCMKKNLRPDRVLLGVAISTPG
jgi:hypothetical protein